MLYPKKEESYNISDEPKKKYYVSFKIKT